MDEGHNITHISHHSDIDKRRKGQGREQTAWLHSKTRKKKEEDRYRFWTQQIERKTSKREYKYIGR